MNLSSPVTFYLGDEYVPYIVGEPEDPKDKQEYHPPDYPDEEPLEEYEEKIFVLAGVDVGEAEANVEYELPENDLPNEITI